MQFPNWLPEDPSKKAAAKQGLMQFGASLLGGRGNFGEILGQGLQAGSQGYQGALAQQQAQALQAMQAKRFGLENQKLQAEIDEPAQLAQIAADTRARLQLGGQPSVKPVSALPQIGQAAQPSEPQAQASAPAAAPSRYEYYRALQEDYAIRGKKASAELAGKMAEAERPKLKEQKTVTRDGKRVLVNTDEYGAMTEVAGYAPDLEKLAFQDRGGAIEALDPYTGQPVNTLNKSQSPDSIASINQREADSKRVNARAADANAIAAGQRISENSTTLRKEFEALPEVKNYKLAAPTYQGIVDAASRNTSMADINLVYGIAKMYDPNSVVREGEYATVANSPNIPERIKGYAQYLQGGGRLTPAVKAQIVAEAKGRMQVFEDPYQAARNGYESIAKRSGAEPTLLFPQPHKPAIKPEVKPVKDLPKVPPKVATAADYAKVPSGATYTAPDGSTRRKP